MATKNQRGCLLPGFGSPVADGWTPTVDEYRRWLEGELETVGHPVDLVRTWVSDVLGAFDEDYVWHDLAQQWQTPGQGEAAIEAMTAPPAQARAAAIVGGGMHTAIAERVAPGIDDVMGSCILRLYRSAAQPAVAQLSAHLGVVKKLAAEAVCWADGITAPALVKELRAGPLAGLEVFLN